MKKEIICITCPKGCRIQMDESGEISGYTCKKGLLYAQTEFVSPKRVITSTVGIEKSDTRISVKTNMPVPKEQMMEVMKEIRHYEAPNKPIQIGEVILSNVCGLGVDVIATKEYK